MNVIINNRFIHASHNIEVTGRKQRSVSDDHGVKDNQRWAGFDGLTKDI